VSTTTTAPVVAEAVTTQPDVTTQDCDACGYSKLRGASIYARISQAFVRVTLPTGGQLTLCGHHGDEHGPALLAAGASIEDSRKEINARPSVSANAL
jgi:biotin synthase-related radical SAM superfamily protein